MRSPTAASTFAVGSSTIEHRETGEDRSGKRDALSLTAGDEGAALPDRRIQTPASRRPLAQSHAVEDGQELFVGRGIPGEQQVLTQVRVEEVRLLLAQADHRAHIVLRAFRGLDARDPQAAAVVEEPGEHVSQRGLSGSRRAGQHHPFPRRELERDVGEHVGVVPGPERGSVRRARQRAPPVDDQADRMRAVDGDSGGRLRRRDGREPIRARPHLPPGPERQRHRPEHLEHRQREQSHDGQGRRVEPLGRERRDAGQHREQGGRTGENRDDGRREPAPEARDRSAAVRRSPASFTRFCAPGSAESGEHVETA